jgi:outer membrane protein TolC
MRILSKNKAAQALSLIVAMVFLVSAPVMAADDTDTLTLQEAIDLGYTHSIALQKANTSLDSARNTQKQTMENQQLSNITYVEAANSNSVSLNAQIASESYKQTRDAVLYDITKKYWEVKKYQEHLTVAELSYKKSQRDLGIARLNAAVGLGTNATVLSAGSTNAQAKTSLESAQTSLNNAWSNFNTAIGLTRDARPVLSEEIPGYQTIHMSDLSIEISQAVGSNPSIWQAQQAALIAQNKANAMILAGKGYYDYMGQLYATTTAELSVQSTEKSVATTTEQLFYNIQNLEQTYKQLLVSQEAAAEAYRVKKLMYEVGVATQNDVLATEVALASVNMSINDSKYNNNLLAIAFEKPWATSAVN